MQEALIVALHERRAQIRERWEALLRVERVTTPLANPDALVHLIDSTLDEVIRSLRAPGTGQRKAPPPPSYAAFRATCACGRNPLLAYFIAGEQALLETLVLLQSESPRTDAGERSTAVAELYLVIRRLARREVEGFCGVCQYRESARLVQPAVAAAATD